MIRRDVLSELVFLANIERDIFGALRVFVGVADRLAKSPGTKAARKKVATLIVKTASVQGDAASRLSRLMRRLDRRLDQRPEKEK